MEQRLLKVAQSGDINGFYGLLRHDPNVLELFDKISFADTPLHVAATAGRTHFALEMLRLKPSFGRKLNPDGFSPLDLALHYKQIETVRRLANYDPQLIRVQGREGASPLHYVAEIDDADLLAEFLLICPASIEDLTIRAESVAHIAVRNGSFRAFKVLMGWLRRADKIEVLTWRNDQGNTVLHIAADTKQLQVMKLIRWEVRLNDMNLEGLTALDIAKRDPEDANAMTYKELLPEWTASEAASLGKIGSLADFLCTGKNLRERFVRLDVYRSVGLSNDMRNAILVVAVLIATATFQAVLQPPGGVSQGDPKESILDIFNATTTTNNNNNNNNTVSSIPDSDHKGKAVMEKSLLYQFILYNSITFAASLGTIYMLLPPTRFITMLTFCIFFLMLDYMISSQVVTSIDYYTIGFIYLAYLVFCFLMYSARRRRLPKNVTALRRLTGSYRFHDRDEMQMLLALNKYQSSRSDEN